MLARKALAGTAGAPKEYVEDVFSTWLHVGTGATNTISNSIDISGEGGLVWIKGRGNAEVHGLFDTARGANLWLSSNITDAETTYSGSFGVTAFNNNGFTMGTGTAINANGVNYVSWTFRKAKKFFDVVTYTGNGTTQAISHNLGSAPGSVWVKSTSAGGTNWFVWHRSLTSGYYIYLNTTGAQTNANNTITFGNNTTTVDPTSTNFTIGSNGNINDSGQSYVAYLFAHDAGGFGDAGSDSIIKCGSYTGIGASSGPEIDLGWEPQWLLIKAAESANNWLLFDNMRGMNVIPSDDNVKQLFANTSGAEASAQRIIPTATGFKVTINDSILNSNGATYIYIAIRRGPMKTPETGTSIFTPTAFSGNDTSGTRSAGLNAFDLLIAKRTASSALDWVWLDKLRGLAGNRWMASNSTNYEVANGGTLDTINTINGQYTQDGINITKTSNYSYLDAGSSNYVWYAIKRAPKFFDVVCYTGTGSARTISHNLGVVPELMIVKRRDASASWAVYTSTLGNTGILFLDLTGTNSGPDTQWNSTTPTSSVFSLGSNTEVNANGGTFVAYLFASLSGISKIGSYSGNGSNQTINCGFTSGVRFVLIKSQSGATGDWVVFDSARGIVSGNDPYLRLNSTAVEVTDKDAVDTDNTGFVVNETTGPNVNTSGVTYLYLAIA